MSAGFFDSWRVQCAMRGALSEEREAMITRLEDEWITCTEERRREIFTQYQVYTGMRPPPTERPKPSPESIASQMDARMPPQYDAETRKAALDFLLQESDLALHHCTCSVVSIATRDASSLYGSRSRSISLRLNGGHREALHTSHIHEGRERRAAQHAGVASLAL